MATTPVSVEIPIREWVDLYEVTGYPRGSVLIVENVGASDVLLATARDKPANDTKAYHVITPRSFPMKNDGGDYAEWAFSQNQEARLNVRLFE